MAPAVVIKMNGTKNILALLLLLSLGYTSGSQNGSFIDCEENKSTWMIDCNRCECEDGLESCVADTCLGSCSADTCLPNTDCGEENSNWMIDCNICKCKDGLADCTEKTCLPNTECGVEAEGATWKDGCNFCYCFNGQVSCSDNTCLPNIERITLIDLSESNIMQDGGFMPGGAGPENLLTEDNIFWNPNPKPWFVSFDFTETYKVNNVTIINTGDSVHDVTSFAVESSNDNQIWTQVKVISNVASGDDQPQFFSISGEGRYWKLTIKKVATEFQPWVTFFGFFGNKSKSSEPECVEGTSWAKECNICNCVDGYAVCSPNTCLPECIEGSYYMVDCNICKCYGGKIECSNLNCLSDPVPKCNEGSRWIEKFTDNCNRTCICSNGMTTCTEKICLSVAEDDVSTTPPIDDFQKECNDTASIAGCNVMKGPKFVQDTELCSMKRVDGEVPKYYPHCKDCTRKDCDPCDDCANISKCHRFTAETCTCKKIFRCKI